MFSSLVSFIRPLAESCASAGQTSLLVLFPHGGQASARRNAYRAVLLDESAAAHRRRINVVVDQASAAHIYLRAVTIPEAGQLTHA